MVEDQSGCSALPWRRLGFVDREERLKSRTEQDANAQALDSTEWQNGSNYKRRSLTASSIGFKGIFLSLTIEIRRQTAISPRFETMQDLLVYLIPVIFSIRAYGLPESPLMTSEPTPGPSVEELELRQAGGSVVSGLGRTCAWISGDQCMCEALA
jgi:hypothetical protein